MTTQAYIYKPGDLLHAPQFSEGQLLAADLARLRAQEADPFGRRAADHATRRDATRVEFQARMSGVPGSI